MAPYLKIGPVQTRPGCALPCPALRCRVLADQEIVAGFAARQQLIEPLGRCSAAGPFLALGSTIFSGRWHGRLLTFCRTHRLGQRLPGLWPADGSILRPWSRRRPSVRAVLPGRQAYFFLQFGGLLFHLGNLLPELDKFIHVGFFQSCARRACAFNDPGTGGRWRDAPANRRTSSTRVAWTRQAKIAPSAAMPKMWATLATPRPAWLWTDFCPLINKVIHKNREQL